ncbi:hypothetical protein [Plantactinospora sp. CA-290183]|uniref:hypothetical protein n=1 Tax=Plantactinospora sp. CA-290183 TaxID=3240006 RepID=UPI003D94D559
MIDDEIRGDLFDFPVVLPPPGAPVPDGLPARWAAVARETDPAARRAAALSRWEPEFLAMVPRFATALREQLVDVRVARHRDDGTWVLVYPLRTDYGVRCWIGHDPDAAGSARPQHWKLLPEPARRFLTGTHAGFTDGLLNGLMAPKWMDSFARWAEIDDGPIPGWDGTDGRISSTELIVVATDGGALHLCVSPLAPPGAAVLVYEGDVSIRRDFATELDEVLCTRLEFG